MRQKYVTYGQTDKRKRVKQYTPTPSKRGYNNMDILRKEDKY